MSKAPPRRSPASSPSAQPTRRLLGERITVVALAAIVATLAYVRLHLLPDQVHPQDLVFDYRNPLLDAQPGERVLFFTNDNPGNQSCAVVRPEGVVLRPHAGPARLGVFGGLRSALPYVPCSMRDARGGATTCGGAETDTVLFALNYFGMPHDTDVRVDSIRPRWMRWGQRDLVVYEVILERYGTLGGRWTTFQTPDAPVAGLVKYTSLLPSRVEVHYREVLESAR